ncbi:MAG: DUF3857 domain-containing protein [Acidobacteria bacterium]|nr:DUF3857 domain-containing protein [Acidobacteriota bacterium]
MRRLPVALAAALALSTPAFGAGKSAFGPIAPGSTTMTDDEKAIVSDPNAGAEQGVVLVEETEQDDTGKLDRTRFHLRAKILSTDARSLGDISIPLESEVGYVKEWWGRTILPDGAVLELKQSELKEQILETKRKKSVRALKAILPGVAPGCVVDFGWTVWDTSQKSLRHVPIQLEWPVRNFRYHWLPPTDHGTGWGITHREGLTIEQAKEGLTLVVTGRDLPAVADEPFMPPGDEGRATLWMYHTSFFSTDAQDFWNTYAKGIESQLNTFASFRPPVDKAMTAMEIPEGADLMTKLRKAYDWLGAHVKHAALLSAEEDAEAQRALDASKDRLAGEVLRSGVGASDEIAWLYVTIARRLGAEASLVLAADRSDHYWHPDVKTMSQFDGTLVAVRARGEPDEKLVFVSPSSGLPFGEVAWWYTGIPALLVSERGARSVVVWDAPAKQNVSDSRVDLSFDAEGEGTVRWLRSGAGQQGYLDRLSMRALPPDDRRRRMDQMCGSGSAMEIGQAEMPALALLNSKFLLRCEGTLAGSGPTAETGEFTIEIGGPWIPTVPELTAATRTYPVVLDFPAVDLLVMEVSAPPGYAPADPPAPVKLEGDSGSYVLNIERTAGGFKIQRNFARLPLVVKPADYRPFRDFLQAVRLADRTRLRFVKAEAPRS